MHPDRPDGGGPASRAMKDAVDDVAAAPDLAARARAGWRRRRDRRRTGAAALSTAAVVGLGVGALSVVDDGGRADVAAPPVAGSPADAGTWPVDPDRSGVRLDAACAEPTVADQVGAAAVPGSRAPVLRGGWATDTYGKLALQQELLHRGDPDGTYDFPTRAGFDEKEVRGATVLCFFDGEFPTGGAAGEGGPGVRGVEVSFDPLFARVFLGALARDDARLVPPPPGATDPTDDVGTWGTTPGQACLARSEYGLFLVLVEDAGPDGTGTCVYRIPQDTPPPGQPVGSRVGFRVDRVDDEGMMVGGDFAGGASLTEALAPSPG